jgi:hypothetical protein
VANSPTQAPQKALAILQTKFCFIDLAGEIRILDREQISSVIQGSDTKDVSFYRKPDGEMLMKRHLELLAVACTPKNVIADFWRSPSTLVYDRIAFTPRPTSATTLNYWSSYTAKPTDGDWVQIGVYLFDVLCSGDVANNTYLLKFLAHMLQKPEEKPGVILALLGAQGTGKGVFFSLLRAIWARTTVQVSDVDEVIGRFNAVLERNYVVCLDEALFKGDGRSLERLKSLVTEPVTRIEEKFQPSRSIGSVHRFFAASNHSQIARIERDDRRFFFLRVSDIHQQDTGYFATICAAIEDAHVLGGLVLFLENLDLTGFDVRKRPQTTEHASQKLKSLQGFERYWHEVLSTGNFDAGDYENAIWTIPVFRSTNSLTRAFKEFDKQAGRFAAVQQAEVVETIKKVCPSAEPSRKMINNKQQRGFDLPSIEVARKEFESYLGCTVDWEDEEQAKSEVL